jgi:acyl-coenzyme A synthetase/AMP-(fatty) acid ligase
MKSSSNRLFFVDEKAGLRKTFVELWHELCQPELDVYSSRPFASVYDTFFNIIVAVLSHQDVVLLDQDFSEAELQTLLGDLSKLFHKVKVDIRTDSIETLADGVIASQSRLSLFTSGTTGIPKQFSHPVATFTRSVRQGDAYRDDVWGFAYNATHMAGLQVLFQALCNGNTLVNIFGHAPDAVFEQLERYGITHLSATPTFFRLISHTNKTFPQVRRITFGGEKSNAELYSNIQRIFPNAKINNIYASTELGSLFVSRGENFTVSPELARKVKIIENVLFVHSSLRGQSEQTHLKEWFNTGDIVEVLCNEPLEFRFAARASDFVNVAGYNVNPKEIEDILLQHPGIVLANVYGKENKLIGNLLVGEVVLKDTQLTEKEIRSYLAEKIQPYKIPRIIKVRQTLEVTRTGKVKNL